MFIMYISYNFPSTANRQCYCCFIFNSFLLDCIWYCILINIFTMASVYRNKFNLNPIRRESYFRACVCVYGLREQICPFQSKHYKDAVLFFSLFVQAIILKIKEKEKLSKIRLKLSEHVFFFFCRTFFPHLFCPFPWGRLYFEYYIVFWFI